MAKQRAKKTTKKAAASPTSNICGNDSMEHPMEDKEETFSEQEVERQSAAIRAIRDVETERLLTGLRLLRSYFSKDQLQTPVLPFFKEHFPNLVHVGNGKDEKYVLGWKEKDDNLYISHADGGNIHASLLHQLSMAYPDYSATMPPFGDCGMSTKTVKARLLDVANLNIKDFNLEDPSATQILGLQDSLQTPGAYSQRLSVGMTPKSRRVPKHGEVLMSVHGSPLGVYKEDNMDAIHEHVGGVGSVHHDATTQFEAFKNQGQSISHMFSSQSRDMEIAYHTRLTATLDVTAILLRQGLSFRGHDESSTSMNRGNFLEFLDWYSKRNANILKVVNQNAPGNNQMTSPLIQKQMTNACAVETTLAILNDIGDSLFTILVDESRDISVKEQMAVVLRYVNNCGEVIKRFLAVVHVADTSSQCLKDAIDVLFSKHGLSLSRLRGWCF